MSEIDVSAIQDAEVRHMSGSRAELGDDAGRFTWRNCVEWSEAHPIVTDENRQGIRDHFADYGAWEDSEIDAWDDTELGALVWQESAADYREFLEHCGGSLAKYRKEGERGQISARLFISAKRHGKRTITIYLGV